MIFKKLFPFIKVTHRVLKLNYTSINYEGTPRAVKLPDEVDVAIIGGGVFGCSLLYHLSKEGINNTALFERGQLTSGTTWHTAGLIWRLRPSDLEIQLLNYTRHLMKSLEKETGIDPGWMENGGLFLASNEERLKEYKRLSTLGKFFDVESYVLEPSDVKEIYPQLDANQIFAALYSPGDGSIDPTGYCNALTSYAKKSGAKVFEGCPVRSIQVAGEGGGPSSFPRVQGLHVTRPDLSDATAYVRCGAVVNCTGVWAPELAATCGVAVPQTTLLHSYIVSDTVYREDGTVGTDPGSRPRYGRVPNVRDHDRSIYVKLQGKQSLAFGGYEMNPTFPQADDNKTPPLSHQSFNLFNLDWDVFDQNLKGSLEILPMLRDTVRIKSTICGYESFTPDHKPLLGEDVNVMGYYHGSGFNSSGMMLSGGCGKEVAKLIAHGRTDLDMFNYDIRRFNKRYTNEPKWIRERSHEAYAKNYSIVFPYDEPLAGRNIRKSPLHQILLDQGCIYQERHGWERPGWFIAGKSVAAGGEEAFDKAPVLPYDFYGAYDHTPRHKSDHYASALKYDYTFSHPLHHDSILRAECQGCRTSCTIFDMSYFGNFYLTSTASATSKHCGSVHDVAEWLFCSRVSPTTPSPNKPVVAGSSTVYTCALNGSGGIENDLTVSPLDPTRLLPFEPAGAHYYMAVGGASAQYFQSHVERVLDDLSSSEPGQPFQLLDGNIKIVDLSDRMGLLSVQGPNSRKILQTLVDVDLSNENFPFSTHKLAVMGNRYEVRLLRISFVGELGWEIHMKNEDCVQIYDLIMGAGQKFGGIKNAGYRALDSLSLEKGYYHWHSEIRTEDTPFEAGLGFTCNKLDTSIPFLGRESLVRFKESQRAGVDGYKKRLAFFVIDENIPLFGLETIWRNGTDCVGFLRRAGYSFTMEKSIGFGYVHSPNLKFIEGVSKYIPSNTLTNEYLKDGTYEIESFGKRYRANLYLKSPFDPKNLRIKGIY